MRNYEKDVIKQISRSSLKFDRLKSSVSGIVIALVTFLLTVFLVVTYNSYVDFRDSLGSAEPLSVETFFSVFLIVIFITFACWVVIYNIFYISVTSKIKEFGQLISIGATKKQIFRIISIQGKMLCKKFIPIGALLGSLVAWALNPEIWSLLPNLIIVVLVGIFVYVTVKLALITPAKMASNITPVSAMRISDSTSVNRKMKVKKSRLSPLKLAFLHLTINKRKSFLTVLSLTICGVLFVSFSSLIGSVSPEARADFHFPNQGQYMIEIDSSLVSKDTSVAELQSYNELLESFKSSILSINGVEEVYEIKYIEANPIHDALPNDYTVGIASISDANYAELQDCLIEGSVPSPSSTENQIVINAAKSEIEGNWLLDFEVGETINFKIQNGEESVNVSFEVAGIVYAEDVSDSFYMAEETMEFVTPYNSNRSFEVVADSAENPTIEEELNGLVEEQQTLSIISYEEVVKGYEDSLETVTLIAFSFVVIFGLFSLVNLVNITITNITARKEELRLLRSIGMTTKQSVQMIFMEVGILVATSFTLSVFFGCLIGFLAANALHNVPGLYYIIYQFPTLPLLAYSIAILVILCVCPYFIKKLIQKTIKVS